MVSGNRTMLGHYAGIITRSGAMIIDIVIVSVTVILINWMISLPFTYFFGLDLSIFCSDISSSVSMPRQRSSLSLEVLTTIPGSTARTQEADGTREPSTSTTHIRQTPTGASFGS